MNRFGAQHLHLRTSVPFVLIFIALMLLPLVANGSVLSLLTLVLMFAYFGQSWNLMMGFVGQLSLGHALFVGIGAYSTAIAIGEYGIGPWAGIVVGMLLSALIGGAIAWLGFRFAVRGIYFTLLTIAFAELGRLLFENWSFVGGNAGYFLKASASGNSLLTLRGGAVFYYLSFLVLCALALVICTTLSRSRLGYLWRSIREDEDAARAIGVSALKLKILAFMISAAMTSVGGSFYALFNGSLFPDNVMGVNFSIEIIVAPIIGGLGTLLGPILGALFSVPVSHLSTTMAQSMGIFGLNALIYGLLVLAVISFLPNGLSPTLAKLMRLLRTQAKRDQAIEVNP